MKGRCAHCGTAFDTSNKRRRFCGKECWKAAYRAANRERILKRQAAYRAAKRKRLKDLKTGKGGH